jgi:hypothetical protein
MKPQGSPPPRKFGDFRGADEGKGDFKDIKGRSRWAAFGSLREWFGWRFILANCLDDFRVSNSEMPIWSWIKHLDQKSRNSGEFISKFSKFIRDGRSRSSGNGCRQPAGGRLDHAAAQRGREVLRCALRCRRGRGSGFSGSLVWGILDNQLQGLNGDNICRYICWSTQS